MTILSILSLFLASYLIGAIPFSYLIGKICGVDIRKIGSGNVGATNVLRSCGKVPGIFAYLLDIGKGSAAVIVLNLLHYHFNSNGVEISYAFVLIAAAFAILGHTKSVFIKFAGGKGVAISAGVMMILLPVPFALTMVVFFLVFIPTRTVSIASISASLVLPLFVKLHESVDLFNKGILSYKGLAESNFYLAMQILSLLLMVFIVVKHRANIKRILKGEEHSFKKKG